MSLLHAAKGLPQIIGSGGSFFVSPKRDGDTCLTFVAQDPGALMAIQGLISNALTAPNVSQVILHFAGIAEQRLKTLPFAGSLSHIDPLEFRDLRHYKEVPNNRVVITLSEKVGPHTAWIKGASEAVPNFAGNYLVLDGYGLSPATIENLQIDRMNSVPIIRSVFCQDRYALPAAKKIADILLAEKVLVSGTGHFDEIIRTNNCIDKNSARDSLGIADGHTVFLYLGSPTLDTYDTGGGIRKVTQRLGNLISSMKRFMYKHNGGKNLTLIYRPHPRSQEDARLALHKAIHDEFKFCVPTWQPIQVCAAAADLIVAENSTEAIKAPYRGVPGILLERNWSKTRSQCVLPDDTIAELETMPGLYIPAATTELSDLFNSALNHSFPVRPPNNSTKVIMREILA